MTPITTRMVKKRTKQERVRRSR